MNRIPFLKYSVYAVLVLLASCGVVTKHYRTPEINTGGLYRGSTTTDTATLASVRWEDLFTDTVLQGLIRESISNNLDLKVAYTRVQTASATLYASKLAFLPTLNGTAQGTFQKFPSAFSSVNTGGSGSSGGVTGIRAPQVFQLGVNTSWEADIWGKLTSTRNASLAAFLQSEANARAVQTSLIATLANSYYSLLALDRQLEITEQNVRSWEDVVETSKALKEAGNVTGAAVVQSEASKYALEVTIPDLKRSIRETENAISILLGRAPNEIPRSKFESQVPTDYLKTGVPAQLLSNRPDVQQAEYNFRYYFEQTNVARTYFYPSFTITGNGALIGFHIDQMFTPNAFLGSLVAGLTQPIFNRGLNNARLRTAKAQQEEAYYNFQSTLLTSGQEVSNAVYSYDMALEKINVRDSQLHALEKSVEYTDELLQNGFANYLEVLTARQSLQNAQISSVNDRLQQLQATVNLYRALGGGWK